jgi:hypothetical protein
MTLPFKPTEPNKRKVMREKLGALACSPHDDDAKTDLA